MGSLVRFLFKYGFPILPRASFVSSLLERDQAFAIGVKRSHDEFRRRVTLICGLEGCLRGADRKPSRSFTLDNPYGRWFSRALKHDILSTTIG